MNAATEITEGDSTQFNIYRIGATALTHQVSYATSPGTAIAGSDYNSASGTVTFAPNETNQYATVTTIEDSTTESNETFTLTLSNPTLGATISGGTHVTTIVDDDNVPSTPQNLQTTDAPVAYGGDFSVLWDASTGPVSYYQLEENFGAAMYQISAPTTFRGFLYPTLTDVTWWYRVRACTATNQCSTWSNDTSITTCPEGGCP